VNHPFGNHGEFIRFLIQTHTQQRQYVWVPEMPPSDRFSDEFLLFMCQ
jgi:hypothetical protein